jgi:hypothetical protein
MAKPLLLLTGGMLRNAMESIKHLNSIAYIRMRFRMTSFIVK